MTRKSDKTTPFEGERIAKVISRAGLCSRREAEVWIAAGRVAVNGKKIASPALNVTASDRISVDGTALPQRERTRLFLYHKPRELVTTHADPQGRPTIFAALPKSLPRLISVGRLDINTEGLLLLTNDGELARMLELPDTGWLRRYRVRAHGRVTQERLDSLRRGVTVDGIHYGPVEASLDRSQGANVWLTFAIREGKNREVRNVLGHLGLRVNRLIRVSFGPFQLGDLPAGAIEEVKTRTLREQLGEKLIARIGADFSSPLVEHMEAPAQMSRPHPDARAEDVKEPRDKKHKPRPHDRTDAPRKSPTRPHFEARSEDAKSQRDKEHKPSARDQAEWNPVSRTQVGYSRLGHDTSADLGQARDLYHALNNKIRARSDAKPVSTFADRALRRGHADAPRQPRSQPHSEARIETAKDRRDKKRNLRPHGRSDGQRKPPSHPLSETRAEGAKGQRDKRRNLRLHGRADGQRKPPSHPLSEMRAEGAKGQRDKKHRPRPHGRTDAPRKPRPRDR